MFLTCRFYLFILCFFFLKINCFGQHKAIFIILDGIPADVLQQVSTPYLDSISAAGHFGKAYVGGELNSYNLSPTISAPGYNHILTGTWSNKHNVWDNKIDNPNYNYWNIFRIAKMAKPSIQTAIFSTWEDNRVKLIGEGLPSAGGMKLDYAFDGFEKDTIHFPHIDETYIAKIDRHVAAEAARYISSDGPDLSWVYLEYTDDMGHKYGDSEPFYSAISKADDYVGEIWQAVRAREKRTGEKWIVVVTTDHGRQPETGKHHGGQSERERTTWLATNIKDVNDRFSDGLSAVDICPTLLRFLDISAEQSTLNELDGVPFIGSIAFTNLTLQRNKTRLKVSWKPLKSEGRAKLYASTTDNAKDGRKDDYIFLGEVEIRAGKFSFTDKKFKKILMIAPENRMTRWVR